MIQLRSKALSDKAFLEYALRLKALCKACGVIFIINDRADIALACKADGLHIGQDDIEPSVARRLLGRNKIIGLSAHSIAQARRAARDRSLDYIGLGPIFKTTTKPGARPIGMGTIRRVTRIKGMLPLFVIGGINIGNIKKVIAQGAKAIAVSGAVFSSKQPSGVVRRLKKDLE